MSIKGRVERLERAQPQPAESPEAVARDFFARLVGIRKRLLASDRPLPAQEEMSIAEKMAMAETIEEWDEAVEEWHQVLAARNASRP